MPRTSSLAQAARIEPDAALREALAEVASTLPDAGEAVLRYADGSEVTVPSALVDVLRAAAGELSAGHTVTILASQTLLSPVEAARLLGPSRPFVVRLLDEGALPSDRLPGSRHPVILLEDVLAFAERRNRRREGRRRLAEAVEEADLPY
jgi:excisionase family DNA binding protein